MEKKQVNESILLDKLKKAEERYEETLTMARDLCDKMKEHILQCHSKHQKEYNRRLGGDKFLDSSFNYKGRIFYIRLWLFANINKNVQLYTLKINEDWQCFINVEVSNHAISKEFSTKMYGCIVDYLRSIQYLQYVSKFDDINEVNELNAKMVEIPKPSYTIEGMSFNETLCEIYKNMMKKFLIYF